MKYLIAVACLLSATALFAQAAPPASTPVTGLEVAIAGGVVYGIKKFMDKRIGSN